MTEPKLLSRHDFSDGRCIEQLEDPAGRIYYRVCSDGGGCCRYCEDLWMAQMYAEEMCQQRRLRQSPAGTAASAAGESA